MPNEQIFSHHHFDYHSLMRVPSVCAMCVRSVCVECVWSVVRFQFRSSSACKMDQRSARFTDPTTHPCHVAMPGQIPNQSIAASARTHTHTRVHMRRLLWHSRTPWPGPEVLAISRDKQLARAVRRKQIATAVGHLEASRREQSKTHLEKGSTEHMLSQRVEGKDPQRSSLLNW